MLSPALKEELASALATSAIGYAKMSQTDPSLNVSPPSETDAAESTNTLIPREATGPLRKRKLISISGDDSTVDPPLKKSTQASEISPTMDVDDTSTEAMNPNGEKSAKARETRLEQNRIAARKSRMRKKTMIHNFHHSIMYYTRANAALQQENDTLEKMLKMAQEFVKNQNGVEAQRVAQDQDIVASSEVSMATRQVVEQNVVSTTTPNTVEENTNMNTPDMNASTNVRPSSIQNILEATRILSDTMSGNNGAVPIPEKSLSELCTIAESISKESVPATSNAKVSPSHQQTQIAQSFSAAAACAANLQVAAANFQAALVASLGNPFLNQFQNQNQGQSQSQGQGQSTGSLIQNYPVLMPYFTGSNVYQNQFSQPEVSSSGVTQESNNNTHNTTTPPRQESPNSNIPPENVKESGHATPTHARVVV